MKKKGIYLINPVILFTLGTFMGILPGLIKDNLIFDAYNSFVFTNEIFYVYLTGLAFFSIGYIISQNITKVDKSQFVLKKLNSFEALLVSFFLLILLIISISIYGGVPILEIIQGNFNISEVNEIQEENESQGFFGFQYLVFITLILIFQFWFLQISVLHLKTSRKKILIYKLIFILMIFTSLYTGKRQLLVIFFTMTLSYSWLYLANNSDVKGLKTLNKKIIIGLVLIFILFSAIGILRTYQNFSFEKLFFPVIAYASYPFMNLSIIIQKANTNAYSFSLISLKDTIQQGFPYIFRGNPISLVNMPYVEKTSPSSLYGIIFWNLRYIGVVIFTLILGLIIGRIYKKAINGNRWNVVIYSLSIWPLLSIHSYNHFLNVMYFILPVIIGYFINRYSIKI